MCKKNTVVGIPYLGVFSCESVAKCRELAAAIKAGEGVAVGLSYSLSKGNDTSGYEGDYTTTGFSEGDLCTRGTQSKLSLKETRPRKLELRASKTNVPDYPQENGYCTTTKVNELAEGKPCSELDVITGSFLENL